MATGLIFEGDLYTWRSKVAAVSSPYTNTMQKIQPKENFLMAIVDLPHPVCQKVAGPGAISIISSCNRNSKRQETNFHDCPDGRVRWEFVANVYSFEARA
jgi:hypothetical protein